MISGWGLLLVSLAYVCGLFAIAWWGDRSRLYPSHARLRPVIYSLALAVYCSSWTFYGDEETGTTIGDDVAAEGAEPAEGLFGGGPGGLNELRLRFPDGSTRDWGSKEIIERIPPGTVCEAINGGGAGYGDALRRDPALVLAEVRDGLLSPAAARRDYGVAVAADGRSVDAAATARLRGGG